MKLTNERGLSDGLRLALSFDKYSKDKADFSATDLIKPSKIYALEIKHHDDITEDVSDRIYRMMGTIGHSLVERTREAMLWALEPTEKEELDKQKFLKINELIAKLIEGEVPVEEFPNKVNEITEEVENEYCIKKFKILFEKRLFVEIEVDGKKYTLSGQVDRFNIATGELNDYKFTSRFTVSDGGRDEWVKQMNIYRWLLHKSGYDVKSIFIEAVLRDWSKRAALRDPGSPQQQVVRVPIGVWPLEKIEEYIIDRIRSHAEALSEKDEASMRVCSVEERWESSPQFAVKKAGRKTAIRVLDSLEEANNWIKNNSKPGEDLTVENRPGESVRCKSYCPVKDYCSFAKYFAKI